MVWWDRQFVKKVEDNGLKLRVYKRYVDDINVIMNAPSSGLRFVEGKVIQDEHVAELEQDVEADRRSPGPVDWKQHSLADRARS